MAVQWVSHALSYSAVKAAIAQNLHITIDEHIEQVAGRPVILVRFLKMNGASVVARTSGHVIEDPARAMSAAKVDSWCRTLGIDPTTFGIDDIR